MAVITQELDTEDFENDAFLRDNLRYVEAYAALRVRGIQCRAAFRRVFGSINSDRSEIDERIVNLEASAVYNDVFEKKLKTIPIDEMLNERRALHGYLDIWANPDMREAVRVAALKEACMLAGITVIDDEGRTRKAPTLGELYDAIVEKARALPDDRRGDYPEPPRLN